MNREEVLKYQTCILKANIHCEGCKRKVKRILREIEGVYKVEAEFGKVTVLGNADPQTLVDKLVKKGKRVEILVSPKPEDNQPRSNKNLQIDNSNGGGKKKKGSHLQTDHNNTTGGGNKGTDLRIGNKNGNEGGNGKKGKNVQIGNGKGGAGKKGKNLQAHNCNGEGGEESDKLNFVQNEIVEENDDSSQLVNKSSGKKPMKDIGRGSGQNMPNTMMNNGNNNGGNAGVNGSQAGDGMGNGGGGGEGVGGMQSQSNGYQMVNSFQTTQGNYMPMGNFQTTQMGNCPTSQIISNFPPTQMSNMPMGNFQMTQMGNNPIGNFGTTQMGNFPMSNYQTITQVGHNHMPIGNFLTTQMGNIPMHNFHTTPMVTLPIDQMAYILVPAQGIDQTGARGGYNPMNSYGWPHAYLQHQQQPQMVDNESFQPMIFTQPQHDNYMPSPYRYSSYPFINMHEVDDKNNPITNCNVM